MSFKQLAKLYNRNILHIKDGKRIQGTLLEEEEEEEDNNPINILPEPKVYNIIHKIYGERLQLMVDVVSYIASKQYDKIINQYMNFTQKVSDQIVGIQKRAVENMRDLTFFEKIYKFHQKITNIRQFNKYNFKLPEFIDKYAKALMEHREKVISQVENKRSLVNVSCNCDCNILDKFLQEFVDICTYCYEAKYLDGSTLPPVYGGPLISVIPNDEDNRDPDYFWYFLNGLLGFDIKATFEAFLFEFNTDKYSGPIGFTYIIRESGVIPFFTNKCTRNNTTCKNGYGMLYGFLITAAIAFILFAGLYFISPALGNLSTIVILLIYTTIGLFLVTIFFSMAYDYKLSCLTNPDSALTSRLGLPFNTRILPECVGPDISYIFSTYIAQQCPLTAFFGNLNSLTNVTNIGTTCPYLECPARVSFNSCQYYGLNSFLFPSVVALFRYAPFNIGPWLANSCLVRGGCLNFIMFGGGYTNYLAQDGYLAFAFKTINQTEATNSGVNAAFDTCFWLNILLLIFNIGLFIIILVTLLYVSKIVFAVLNYILSVFSLIFTLFQSDNS